MRRCLGWLAIVIALAWAALNAAGAASAKPASAAVDPFRQLVRMGRGVNILGYDPIWNDRSKARFKEEYFRTIRQGGFRTVRVNLQAFAHMDGANRLDPRWLDTLDWVVSHALAAGLVVVLDEHDFGPCSADPDACLPKLTAFWRQVGTRYASSPDTVLFELLNEPHDPLTPARWNALFRSALAVVRETNPTRTVVVGPGSYNDPALLPTLDLPEDDRAIIVTVHYYKPMAFTHQGAAWNPATTALSGVTWGSPEDRKRLAGDFDAVASWARQHRRPIWLGEFGAYDKAPLASRAAYDAAVARAAERRGWAWCYWQFDSDFVVFDVARDQWVAPIWHALVPKGTRRS